MPPQFHEMLPSPPSKPIAAICGNSLGSAFVPPTISLRVFRAHKDTLTGLLNGKGTGGICRA